MGMEAVGVYLKTLRERKNLSQTQVAALIDSNEMQIRRIEKGNHRALGPTLIKVVAVLQGSFDHILALLDEKAPIQLGQELARQMLEMQPSDQHRALLKIVIEQVISGKLSLDEAISRIESLTEAPEGRQT